MRQILWRTCKALPETGWRPSREIAKGNIVSGLMSNSACVLSGGEIMLRKLR
jgi:hypothetical protein